MLIALVAALTTGGFTFLLLRLTRKFQIHRPVRERDQHQTPVPRIGGAAIFLGFLVAMGSAASLGWFQPVFAEIEPILGLLGAAVVITVVGLLDDLIDMDWTLKLAGQFGAAGILAWSGVQIVSLPIGGITIGSYGVSVVATVIIVVAIMNAVNFIDGLDGLAAGVILIGTGTFFIYSYLLAQQTSPTNYFNTASLISVIILGACVGFLPFNWRPAKIFMGDSGAMLLGLMMAASAIMVTGQIDPATVTRNDLLPALLPLVLPVAILILPLLDLIFAVLRRLRKGQSPFAADRGHLHHRLQDIGHSHLGAVFVFYHWTAIISLTGLLFFFFSAVIVVSVAVVGFLGAIIHTMWPVLSSRYEKRLQ